MTKVQGSRFYTVPEVARMLRVSASTVWRWIEEDRLPAYRVGAKNIRIKQEDVDRIVRPVQAAPRRTSAAKEKGVWEPPTKEEMARRQELVAELLEMRKELRIAPLTTADLVRTARNEREKHRSQQH